LSTLQKSIIISGVIAAFLLASVVMATSLVETNSTDISAKQSSIETESSDSMLSIEGFVAATHRDAQGNVLAILESDNVITREGKDCLVEIVFIKDNSASNNCPISWSGGTATDTTFNAIQLYGSGTKSATQTAAGLTLVPVVANGLTITNGVVSGVTAASGSGTVFKITNIFTAGAGVSNEVIVGTILKLDKDSSDGTAIFANTDFAGGTILMNEGESLEVVWTFTIS